MRDVLTAIFTMAFPISIWAVFKPIKKIGILSTREKSIIVLICVLVGNSMLSGKVEKKEDQKKDCDGIEYNDLVAPSFDQIIYKFPDKKSEKLVNEKATDVFGKTEYYEVGKTETVRRICVLPQWTKIKIEDPAYLSNVIGWVPNSSLRKIDWDKDGKRIYSEKDVAWDKDTKKYKRQIVAAINKISRENSQCHRLDTGSVLRSTKSKIGHPLFFVTCHNSSGEPFNVWFNPDDSLVPNKKFTALTPISRQNAIDKCELVAKQAAIDPSTVIFSKILSLSFNTFPTGRARVDTVFTAKNAFNNEIEYNISCLFEGDKLIEKTIYDKY